MKSRIEYSKIAQKAPVERYDKQSYLKDFKADLSKAKKAGKPLLGIIIAKYPLSTGDVVKTLDHPVVIMGIDTKKEFRKFAKKLVVGKEESLKKDVDIKMTAFVEFEFDDSSNTMMTKFIKTKGMPAKILKYVNKKLKKYVQFELKSDDKSEAETDFLEETGSDDKLSGISLSHIKKKVVQFRKITDRSQQQPIIQAIIDDCNKWLLEFNKRSKNKFVKKLSTKDKERKTYVLELKAKFDRALLKVQLEKDLALNSGISKEDVSDWINLYSEIKIEHEHYFAQEDESLEDFTLVDRKDYLEDTLGDITEWEKVHDDISKLSVQNISQEALDIEKKHKDKITNIKQKLTAALESVNKQLIIEDQLKDLVKNMQEDRMDSQNAKDAGKKLINLKRLLDSVTTLKTALNKHKSA